MKSKIDMDMTQLDVYYKNNLYLLEVKEVQKGKPYLICLCKNCHRFLSIPYKDKYTDKLKCKYCNPDNQINEQEKQVLKNQLQENFDINKMIYSNNKEEYLKQQQEKAEQELEQKKTNLQIRILHELKENNIKLTKQQKEYLKEQEQKQKKMYSGSQGEKTIAMLLNQHNIPFKREHTFSDLIYPDTQRRPRFDFWVNNKYIIEFDGSQHYSGGFEKLSGKTLKEQQQDDEFKNEYCFKHHIPIIRIPYWQLNNLTIEDLQLETSSFILH